MSIVEGDPELSGHDRAQPFESADGGEDIEEDDEEDGTNDVSSINYGESLLTDLNITDRV
jgi:hypothetical protein